MKKAWCSPISHRIYIGNVNETTQVVSGKKDDITDSAISAVASCLLLSDTKLSFKRDGKSYELKVSEVTK